MGDDRVVQTHLEAVADGALPPRSRQSEARSRRRQTTGRRSEAVEADSIRQGEEGGSAPHLEPETPAATTASDRRVLMSPPQIELERVRPAAPVDPGDEPFQRGGANQRRVGSDRALPPVEDLVDPVELVAIKTRRSPLKTVERSLLLPKHPIDGLFIAAQRTSDVVVEPSERRLGSPLNLLIDRVQLPGNLLDSLERLHQLIGRLHLFR